MLYIKLTLVSLLIFVFSGCSVKSFDASFRYDPPVSKVHNIKNRVAVISNFSVDRSSLDMVAFNVIKDSVVDTLMSTGIYEKVSYGSDGIDTSKYTVDEYSFNVIPKYTRDFNWFISWPAVYPMPAYWPLQQYTAETTSMINVVSVIDGNTYEKMFSAKDEIFVGFYGFFRTSEITKSLQSVYTKTLEDLKNYLQSDIKVAILQNQNNEPYYAKRNRRKGNLLSQYESVKKQYNFKESTNKNYDSFALVIGINEYDLNTNVNYADLSALAFEELANKTLGVPKENIITLLNHKATSGQIKAKIELLKELSDGNGNLYIYFAGHGVPGKDGNTYLLPSDMSADSIHLEPNLKLDNIYAKLAKSRSKNVFVFMDSCFSGKDDGGSLLYRGVAPVLKTKKTIVSDEKLTIFTAGRSTDFANDFEDKKQRMFSYYLIKELSDGKKDLSTLYPKIKSKVKRASLIKGLGYKQTPQLYGNTKALLSK